MVLALDIGGTHIRSAIVEGAKVNDFRKVRTPKEKKEILKLIDEIIESHGKQKVICVAIAGVLRDGKIVHALNTDINHVALLSNLKKRFGAQILIENDANCAGLAELTYGAGKGKKNFVLLTLGTGIGGAIVIDGKLRLGRGGAGEVGSMIMQDEKIFENLASGSTSARLALEKGLGKIDGYELERRASKGDARALKIYAEIGNYLGIGLANIAYVVDPEMFIIGGGFGKVKHIYAPMKKSLEKHYDLRPMPKIVKAKFGDDAGLIGAGLLAKRNL